MLFMLVEVMVFCSYIEWFINVLWNKCLLVKKDLLWVEVVFNEDYYGFEKVKECIFEYFVV